MKTTTILSTILLLLIFTKSFSQNSPLFIWGSGLDGLTLQKLGIYADTENGFLLDAPKDASGNKLNISFNWRGGGTPPLFIRGSDANVGIGTSTPWEKFHVNGTLGVGTWNGDPHSGLQIQYTDAGGGATSVFKHSRWSGEFYFKRNDAAGERTQLYFGGAGNHIMDIYNNNNEVKVRFNTGGDSYFNGGSLSIGTDNPHGYKLAVNGKTITEEVVVQLYGTWPDYVFESDYKLPSLSELEQYVKTNKHLPDVPTAQEVKENGLSVGEMNAILLKKVEELTLHLIEIKKENEKQDKEILNLKNAKK